MKLLIGLLGALFLVLVLGAVSLLGGTIVWWLWPYSIPVVFPKLVAEGYLIKEIPWLAAVCLTYVFGILIKSSSTSSK